MSSLEERMKSNTVWAFVAPDTIDAIFDRIVGIVGEPEVGRRMTIIKGYPHRLDGGMKHLEITTGQSRAQMQPRFDTQDGVKRSDTAHPSGKIRSLYYGPDTVNSIGLSCYDSEGTTETEVRRRYESGKEYLHADITSVMLCGRPGEPSRSDRIEISYTNSNLVVCETVIVFDDCWDLKKTEEY